MFLVGIGPLGLICACELRIIGPWLNIGHEEHIGDGTRLKEIHVRKFGILDGLVTDVVVALTTFTRQQFMFIKLNQNNPLAKTATTNKKGAIVDVFYGKFSMRQKAK